MRVRTPWPECGSHQCWTVALGELPAGGAQEMLARERRPGDRQRHPVLQLVAEAVGAARLIEGRARPDAAGERLIEQPAVQHDVHGAVGRLHLDGAEHVIPFLRPPRPAPRRDRRCDSARSRRRPRPGSPPRRGRRRSPSRRCGARSICGLQRRAGIEPRAGPLGERRVAGERGGLVQPAVAPEEFACGRRSIAAAARRDRRRRPATRIRDSRDCAPTSRRFPRSISVTTIGAEAPREVPSTHSDIGRDRQPPVPLRIVAHRQPRDLDRIRQRHVLQQLERDAVRVMLEAAVALAVARDIGRGLRRGSAAPSGVQTSPLSSSRR